jgi:hypothetical protein
MILERASLLPRPTSTLLLLARRVRNLEVILEKCGGFDETVLF